MGEEVELSDDVINKTFKSKVTVEAVVENTAGIYKEDILNGADPVLKEGLIPVTINNEGKVTRADTNKKWYNYANQEWANAVILEDDYQDPGAGKEIPEEEIESYFVWIPKYSYQLWDLGEYNSLTEIDETKPHTIPIRFGTTNTTDSKSGECTTPMNDDNTQGLSGESKNCKVGDYMTHPAFISFDVNGLWVGKFETGYRDATTSKSAEVNPTDEEEAISKLNEVIVKPDKYSWRNIQLASAYVISYNYQRSLDSHMIKNTEWGAVAYLSHSVYGINKEIRHNNANDYKTGYTAINPPNMGETTNTLCSDYPLACNEFGPSTNVNVAAKWNTISGQLGSTTGNISGVYDMSGGAEEFVMSTTLNNENHLIIGQSKTSSSGFKGINSDGTIIETGISFPNELKYYDAYKYNSKTTDFDKRILGDATGELGPFQIVKYQSLSYSEFKSSWYDDIGMKSTNKPYFSRSGAFSYGIRAGIFDFGIISGVARPILSFRIVLAITEE